jgi:hypothetical protein
MTNTVKAKAQITVEKADAALYDALVKARNVEADAEVKGAELRANAVNVRIDAGRSAGEDTGETKDAIGKIFEKAVAENVLKEKSASDYMRGVSFALERGVRWSASMHGKEQQVKALMDAGKKIPKALQEAADKEMAKRTAAREAKHGKTHEASKETIVKALTRAYTDAVALGKTGWAHHIREAIQTEVPEWTPPTADAK